MEIRSTEITDRLRSEAISFGNEPLLVSPNGDVITLNKGYIPLLANFSFEDKAAKGLRKRGAEDKPEPAVYFSALELVRDHAILLLSGPSGSGKTSFAKHLAFGIITGIFNKPRPLARNENGFIHDEKWEASDVLPCMFTVSDSTNLRALIDNVLLELVKSFGTIGQISRPSLLIILDTIEQGGNDGPSLLAEILSLIKEFDNIRLLLLGDSRIVKHWVLSSEFVRHDLLPLLDYQRREAVAIHTGSHVSQVATGVGAAAAIPAYFALALEAKHCGDKAEELLDAWLAVVAPGRDATDRIARQVFYGLSDTSQRLTSPILASSCAVQQLLAARHLFNLPQGATIALFHSNPTESEPILRSLLARRDTAGTITVLIDDLMSGSGTNAQLGALLVSDFIARYSEYEEQIMDHMLTIIEQGVLPAAQREKAARVLSKLGDPRDLTALANIPAGEFVLGSICHPTSKPSGAISIEDFRIGLYPVINRDYCIFVRQTGRQWQSPDGFAYDRQNAPATDLTWHDAMAYCRWLTQRWQSTGKIGGDEHVRLPTEPEWECASRGDTSVVDFPIYPWGTEWQNDAANYEASGFNMTCSVGLYPKGRSFYGCYDMAGNIWEWCTTLWGEDMATPSFPYPWRDDGREALEAPVSLRRVLRGGCFSSGRLKICCTYRGSLEPAGFWRGNGFRIVVARNTLS